MTSAYLEQLIYCGTVALLCHATIGKRKKDVFLNANLQCATLYADKHTITGKTYIGNIFVGKILYSPSKKFVITSL